MMKEGFDIDWLVDRGFAADIVKMLVGENEFADLDAFESLDRHSRRLRGMALQHLQFFIEYGDRKDPVEVDGKILSPYPEYFYAWKLAGCPGISLHQLNRLISVRRSSSS
ncbi:hypothetical protein ACC786_17320 [Rhizobium ruizarguesonis]|uniref:hypothetical protein n=1 Tax=Rhizobium ruizarguesonis TaxID=2081791 RepID=UPI00102F9724|nr:hypothetical protein [Rhizobium ruizarguesonis]TAY83989.1 hypothetical protein ELH85_35775 [Rhizobium ruizarguesonis]TBA33533.1 hypothetical protein ELH62_31045 [Rhizobium ruizarguesonis]